MKVKSSNLVPALTLILSLAIKLSAQTPTESKFNKLREMYLFYYLPFNIHFKVGSQADDIFPVVTDNMGELSKTVAPEDMKKVEKNWSEIRDTWKNRSLFLSTSVELGKKIRISPHLVSHKIPVTRNTLDNLSFANKLIFQKTLQDKSPEVKQVVTQSFFLKSFLDEKDKKDFNFFIFSPSWCASSQEYRALFEAYFKKFAPANLTIHSVVIEDPDEAIFDSKLFKELFPNTKSYSHEIVPRFLAIENKESGSVVYEEGEALAVLYENFFKQHQGFLNKMVSGIIPAKVEANQNPFLSSSIAKLPKLAE